nr:MAG TPA: hypothetical protein [Caudoviricetes sp.]
MLFNQQIVLVKKCKIIFISINKGELHSPPLIDKMQ